MDEIDFIEIVPAMDQAAATAKFEAWLRERNVQAQCLDPDDIRIDLIRSHGGKTLKRYRVRRSAVVEPSGQ